MSREHETEWEGAPEDPQPETEWECAPEQSLPVPPEILKRLRYKFTVYLASGPGLHGRCASWDALPGGALMLTAVLSDIVAGAPVIVTELLHEEREPAVEEST